MESVPVIPLVCANWIPGAAICSNEARFACNNCRLVVYCGKSCQRGHWPAHKTVCKSQLGKASWRPVWEREGRDPAWTDPGASRNWHNTFGGETYLWGNIPALNIIQLQQNEGQHYEEDIALLFAASGDLRNVVKTIVDLPTNSTQHIQVTINDREFEVVALNAIWLLFVLNVEDTASASIPSATDSLIHLWYSAFIPASLYSRLCSSVKPLITEVCTKVANKKPGTRLAKTWRFQSGRTLRLTLTKEQWVKLEKVFDVPEMLPCEQARDIRKAITLAPEREDYRHRWYFKDATPFTRVAKQRFREDGLVLPFGHPRIGFDTPNPVLFQNVNTWLMDDKRDPLDGWPISEVRRKKSSAKEDCYGELFAYLQYTFSTFLSRLTTTSIDFEIHCVDAKELPQFLENDKYTRIEASNVSDAAYIGIRGTLNCLSSLLQSPQQNPHATLITLFLNAVLEMVKTSNEKDNISNMGLITNYLPRPTLVDLSPHNADILRIWDARNLTLDVANHFQRYRTLYRFDQISADVNMAEKQNNTIVDQWPMQPKLKRGQEGAQEEFTYLLGSNFSGLECYVEWKRCE